MQDKRKLTKSVIAAAKANGREHFIWDTAIQGFGLRVRPSGARSFVFVYRLPGGRAGKVKRVTIQTENVEQARTRAKKLAGEVYAGDDPAEAKAERRSKATTVAELLDRFIEDHAAKVLKAKTAGEYKRICNNVLKPRLGHHAADALATKHVSEAYQALRAKPTQAALAVRVLSSAMSLAEEWGLRPVGSNPARIRLIGSRRRERLFSDNEVARLHRAIDTLERAGEIRKPVALALRLLFATGCRAGEITSLQWSNVDLAEGVFRWPTWRADGTKTGHLEKPITPEARKLLKGVDRIVGAPLVCPGFHLRQMRIATLERGFREAMTMAGVEAKENASLHLIRHWFASKTYSDKSIPLPLQMRIVGHTAVATAMRYAHATTEEIGKAAAGAAKRRSAAVRAADKRGRVVRLQGRA
jgi:integrase